MNYAIPGPGSLYSSVQDLSRWVHALQNPESDFFDLGQQLLSPGILNSGEKTKYGFGLDWGQCFPPSDSLKVITHSGGHAGFCSIILRCPEKELGVIVLCNTRDISHIEIAFSILKMMINEK